MAVETDPNILDLLFDHNDGLLKEEVPEVQTIDFAYWNSKNLIILELSTMDLLQHCLTDVMLTPEDRLFDSDEHCSDVNLTDSDREKENDWDEFTDDIMSELGLFNGDLLDDNIFSGTNITLDDINDNIALQKEQAKVKDVHFDHDYFTQRSPTHSDSGVSLESSAYSPNSLNYDQAVGSPGEGYISDSPRSQSNFVTDIMDVQSNLSPLDSEQSNSSPLNLEDLDMQDIDLSTVDTSALDEADFLNSLDDGAMDNTDISINVGLPTDTMYDAQTSTENGVKTIKIIQLTSSSTVTDTLPFTMKDVDPTSSDGSKFPDLKLTEEEQELLAREGMSLPTNMPLTKDEERVLKAVRRKIRNKASAKESRKRKQDYVEGLEKRVKLCTVENTQLKKKMGVLEKQNTTLMTQLKKLQAMILSKTKPAQASTCIMVLLLSFAFLIVPNFNPFGSHDGVSDVKNIPIPGKSRSLLYKGDQAMDVDDDPYGLTVKPGPPWENPPKTPAVSVPSNVHVDTVSEDIYESKIKENHLETNASDNVINTETRESVVVDTDFTDNSGSEFSKNQQEEHPQQNFDPHKKVDKRQDL